MREIVHIFELTTKNVNVKNITSGVVACGAFVLLNFGLLEKISLFKNFCLKMPNLGLKTMHDITEYTLID